MKEKIEKWYKMGLWTEEMVMNAVEKGVITEQDGQSILNKAVI